MTAKVFQLDTFVLDPVRETGELPDLPTVQPRFWLPTLNESESSVNRLLDSLNFRTVPRTTGPEPPSSKGKEKAVFTEDIGAEEEEGPDASFWIRASEEEAGPSNGRLFRPLQTWDSPSTSDAPLFSEGSVFGFEALVTSAELSVNIPGLKTASTESPPRDTREVLDLLMRATLGGVNTGGVSWSKREYRFRWKNDAGRLIGLGTRPTSSAAALFLDIATCLRRLEILIDSLSPKPLTPTHHSLLHALSTCLAHVKRDLTATIERSYEEERPAMIKSTVQLQDTRELLAVLCDVIQWPLHVNKLEPLPSRAAIVLNKLYAHLLARLATAPPGHAPDTATLALAYILQRTSQPLLALLDQWVGLAEASSADEETDPDAQPWSDLGITRQAGPAVAAAQRRTWQFTFEPSKMPSFVPKSDRRSLFEAGRSLRLLRDASDGQHPLCHESWGIHGQWGWGEEHTDNDASRSHAKRVEREVEHWRRSTRGLPKSIHSTSSFPQLRQPRKSRKPLPSSFRDSYSASAGIDSPRLAEPVHSDHGASALTDDAGSQADPLWDLIYQQPGSHFANNETSLWSHTPRAEFESFIAYHSDPERPLLRDDAPTLPQHISSHLLAPLLVHADLVSASLVAHYLDELHLLDHLEVLRAFWLGGDVSFLERVNAALFGKDSAGAGEALGLGKRARTRARLGLGNDDVDNDRVNSDEAREWGIGLGIGLSERAKWPPGGAELTYALRSAMVEDDDDGDERGKRSEVWDGIEDKVSYAIKDLPEDRRDGRRAKWLDPQAIEALDFLYLAYSPPPSIAVLLPPSLMEQYQAVHNLLLRLGRVETVLRSLFVDVHHQHDIVDEPVKSGVDAPHDRPSSRNRKERHRQGIFPAGSRHEKQLWHLRHRMSHFITTFNRYVLDIAIGANWAIMAKRLRKLQRSTRSGSATNTSRPSTPASESGQTGDYFDADELEQQRLGAESLDAEEETDHQQSVHRLHSVHSLVLYHQLIMDRIMRSCLLSPSPGHQVVFKLLMTLFGLVLDFGKAVKEVEKGLLGWQDGAERVEGYWREWVEKETVFLHAVERLAMRTSSDKTPVSTDAQGDTERDLDVLLRGDDEDEREGPVISRQGADLQELVLRIKLQPGVGVGTSKQKGSEQI